MHPLKSKVIYGRRHGRFMKVIYKLLTQIGKSVTEKTGQAQSTILEAAVIV